MAPLSASSELPIIDFSKDAMKPGTETWDSTCKHVVKALEEYGCFIATFNEINNDLYTAMFSSLEKLFDLPMDTKRRFASDENLNGYRSSGPDQNPVYEAMLVPDELTYQTYLNLALLMWPQGDATFCETLQSYVTQLLQLEKLVRDAIFQSYGLEKHLGEEFDELMYYSLRLMKYGAPMSDKCTTRGISHYDKNFITILQADGVGLQVHSRDGEWIRTTPSGSSLIVLIGESSFGWSNGRLRCPLHKVMMSGDKSRHSIALFSNKKGKIEIPSVVVDDEHPLRFKPFDYVDLAQIFIQQVKDNLFSGENDNIVPIITTHFAI